MKHSGMNMGQVKKKNRSSILNYICEVGPVSRKDIAQATGLTPAAVTQICNEFMEQGILFETGETMESAGAGRKKVYVDIDYNYAYILAVNIEKEQTTIALTNMKAKVLAIQTLSSQTDGQPLVLLDQIVTICREMMDSHDKIKEKIAGISVGITGIVDKENGKSIKAYGIWDEEVNVSTLLENELHLPVLIENNVNAFARAELTYGKDRKKENLLVIKWGPGVGSTIIIDNVVYEGRKGKAAELGHLIVEKEGELCRCGKRGCLETKVSFEAMAKQYPFDKERFGAAYDEALKKGESQVFDNAIDVFARTIVNCVTILAPNRVMLCGKLFKDERIRNLLISRCKYYDEGCNEKRIVYASLAEQENYVGPVAQFVWEEIF